MNCRFEDWDCPENCPLYTDHMIDDGELYLPINPGHKVLDEMWKESWYNCHRNNWKKRDEEATGTFTFGNGRFSYKGAWDQSYDHFFCYLTLDGAREFGITLDEGPEYNNIGVKSCYRKKSGGKKYTEGVNPWCGKSGLCCRFKQIKDQQSGCGNFDGDKEGKGDPSKNYHHCVKP